MYYPFKYAEKCEILMSNISSGLDKSMGTLLPLKIDQNSPPLYRRSTVNVSRPPPSKLTETPHLARKAHGGRPGHPF